MKSLAAEAQRIGQNLSTRRHRVKEEKLEEAFDVFELNENRVNRTDCKIVCLSLCSLCVLCASVLRGFDLLSASK